MKNEILSFAAKCMGLENSMVNEINQTHTTCSLSQVETKTKELESSIVMNRDWEGCQVGGKDGRKVFRYDNACYMMEISH